MVYVNNLTVRLIYKTYDGAQIQMRCPSPDKPLGIQKGQQVVFAVLFHVVISNCAKQFCTAGPRLKDHITK